MIIKGYPTPSGYMGWINNKYILFPTEDEYIETVKEMET